jgi:hypothetical protein
LYLIQKDVILIFVDDLFIDIRVQTIHVTERFILHVIQNDTNYVVVFYALTQKMVLENLEKQIRFPATTDAGDHFHESVSFALDELFQIMRSIDHILSPK